MMLDSPLRGAFQRFVYTGIKFFPDRNRASRQRMESNERDLLQAIADTTTDALIAINQEGKVIEWNRAAERIFGFSAKEMLGSSLNMVISAGTRP